MIAPITVPVIVPTPPIKLVPPIITDAIASSSKPVPRLGEAPFNLDANKIPEAELKTPVITKTLTFALRILIPESQATFSLPPIAYNLRPNFVLRRIYTNINTITEKIATGIGIP